MAVKKDFKLNLITGERTSPISIEMVNKKYGRLTVLEFIGLHKADSGNIIAVVKAKCECGSVHNYESRHLREGRTTSCGCYQSDFSSKKHTKHGQKSTKYGKRGTIMYARWRSIFDRVRSDPNYSEVKISERWKGENGFVNFCSDMGEMPTPKHTVDRYPIIKGNYEPNNTRWATMREQMQNITKNVKYLHKGELLCISEIARREGINPNTLHYRLRKLKLSLDEALIKEPIKK